ncbi:MAG: PAS domain S-box protein [Thalassobaculum sp.]|uniref:hybrid sensor histidine kinase/response regulator n=1 Tax=Thalassobaculum sp. TaxID=2022740 RepID=UPI0032EEEB04
MKAGNQGVTSPLLRVLLVTGGAFAIAFAVLAFLDYRNVLDEEMRDSLVEAQVAARLIAEVTAPDGDGSADLQGGGADVLRRVERAFESLDEIQHDRDIAVFARDGDRLQVLADHGRTGGEHDDILPVDTRGRGELLRALGGESVVFEAVDRTGIEQIFACAPVASAGWGLCVRKSIRSIRATILERNLVVVAMVLIVMLAMFALVRRQIKPLVAAVEHREKRFRDFAEAASEWFWETDADLRFTAVFAGSGVRPKFEAQGYVGKRREEMTGEDVTTEKWRRHLDDMANRRPVKNFDYDLREGDGKTIHVRVNGIPVFDAEGAFAGYRGIGTDITEETEAEKRLWEATERARIAFENVTVGCITITRDGTIESFNASAEQMFGYDRSEVVGKNVRMLMPASIAVEHDGFLSHYLETGHARVIGVGRETTGLRKSGEEFPIHLGVGELRVGDAIGFIGSITDLTQEKRLAEQLRRSQKMDAVGQLTGGIAHDFNNILGIVIGNIDLVLRKTDADSSAYRQLGRALGAAERGARLTRRLLNFARQTPTTSKAIDVNGTIRDLDELLSRSLTASISLELTLVDGLWRANADPGDLDDALTNLVLNARDAMPSGGRLSIETANVTITDAELDGMLRLAPGEYVRISVSDTGIGMPAAVLDRVFEPFFTTKDPEAGTGLGLPMVYAFARRSGGNVSAYSEEGLGSTFRLYLPRSRAGDANFDVAAPDSGLESPHGSERLLVVDDEKDLLRLAESVLGDLGYSVRTARSGRDGLAMLQQDATIDLLLTDIVMPGGMSGLELADAALDLRPDLKVLLASGYTGSLFDEATAERWAGWVLAKPYSNLALAQAVRRALDGKDVPC